MIMIDKKADAMGGFLLSYAPAFWDREDANEIIRGAQDGFEAGANWALQDFKKSLWHDASEEPNSIKQLLVVWETSTHCRFLDIFRMPIGEESDTWKKCVKTKGITKWLYTEDILPKEGGEE